MTAFDSARSSCAEARIHRGHLRLYQASAIAAQFLAGLEAIHAAGFVHRDLKPENVMLTLANRVVVMDFGIARPLEEPPADTIAGTPGYMAPEQAAGLPIDLLPVRRATKLNPLAAIRA